jgi:hypothetical protein
MPHGWGGKREKYTHGKEKHDRKMYGRKIAFAPLCGANIFPSFIFLSCEMFLR